MLNTTRMIRGMIVIDVRTVRMSDTDKELATLKAIFKYGDGIRTHLNILARLKELGVKKREYAKWNNE